MVNKRGEKSVHFSVDLDDVFHLGCGQIGAAEASRRQIPRIHWLFDAGELFSECVWEADDETLRFSTRLQSALSAQIVL
jgi:hypothetical protein